MTKQTVVADFRSFILPGIIEKFSSTDVVAIRTAWNDWTDSLCKSGLITEKQYNNWTNPF